MLHNKEVFQYCPNFDRIVNFPIQSGDVVTDKLITIYRDFIFKVNVTDAKDVQMMQEFDNVLIKYIDDYLFRKELKKEIIQIKIKRSCKDILRTIVKSVLDIFDNYLYNTTRKVTIARWL